MTAAATTNGNPDPGTGKYIDNIDPDEPEYQRQMRRPAEVKEDVRQMEERRRVSLIMKTREFRDELENIVTETMRSGSCPASLFPLQQICQMILPSSLLSQTSVLTKAVGPVIPISDIHGSGSSNYSKSEKLLRCKLASCYRAIDMFGWSNSIYSLITTRVRQDTEEFLLLPYGLLYHEVTASSLAKVEMSGNILDGGSTNFGIDNGLFSLHATIHAARPDVKCIIHLQCVNAVAVSSMACGILTICPEAINIGEVSYADYNGCIEDDSDKELLSRALGPSSRVLVLKNYGILVCGRTIEESHYLAMQTMAACNVQVSSIPIGLDNICIPSDELKKKAFTLASKSVRLNAGDGNNPKWRRGEIEYEALMRHMDNAGFRTGHMYRESLYKKTLVKDRMNSSIEIPPSSTSFNEMYDDNLISPLKHHVKKQQRCEWLNIPNSYKKEELDETGTISPKKYTRWVPDAENNGGNPIKCDDQNMFAPQGSNPKELKQKVKQIRKDYYEDNINAGPQSKLLDGEINWDDQKDREITVMVGAASKGIIQRDHQHNATVYKQTYASNPFANVSDDDVVRYEEQIKSNKNTPDIQQSIDEEKILEAPPGRLVSSDERLVEKDTESPKYTETCIDDVISEEADNAEERIEAPSPSHSSETRLSSGKTGTVSAIATNVAVETIAPTNNNKVSRSESAKINEEHNKPKFISFLNRSKSERTPKQKKGSKVAVSSPAKSSSSGELLDTDGVPSSKAKKKNKFRIPSFTSKKKDKKNK